MSIFNETATRLAKEVNEYLMSVAERITQLEEENEQLKARIRELEK